MYVPGRRNINQSEAAVRKNIGYAGVSFGIILLLILIFLNAPPLLGISAFLPVWLSAFGFLQSKNEFCVIHASVGVHLAHENQETIVEITEEEHRVTDRNKAKRLHLQTFLIGTLGALASVLILMLV